MAFTFPQAEIEIHKEPQITCVSIQTTVWK